MKAILAVLACLALWFFVAILAISDANAFERNVTLTWSDPVSFATGGDCNATGEPLTPADVSQLQYIVKYKIGGQAEVFATTALRTFTIPLCPVGSLVTVSVAPFLPGGQAECWIQAEPFIVPAPAVGCVKDVTINLE